MSDPYEQALHILQELNSVEETPESENRKHIQIVSMYHAADKNSMQRLASHLNVMKRQVAANQNIALDHESHEIWTDYPSDDVQEAMGRATYLLILMGLEFLTAIYHDAELYQILQQTIRNTNTLSIALMTTKVQWDTHEFPVSALYPQPQNTALAGIRDKDKVYSEIIVQLRQWIALERR